MLPTQSAESPAAFTTYKPILSSNFPDVRIFWFLFILINFGYILLNFKTNPTVSLSSLAVINIIALLFSLLLYKKLSEKLPLFNLIFTLLYPLSITLLTGDLKSPFYFVLLITP